MSASVGGRCATMSASMTEPEPVHLDDDYLARTRALVERAIRRRWSQGLITRDPDGVFTSFLGAGEIERLMKSQGQASEDPSPVGDYAYDPEQPIGRLAGRLALAPSEADLLAVLLAAETDPTTGRLIT